MDVAEKTLDNRITMRSEIEMFCKEVENLIPGQRLLFLLYFRYGHTKADIAALLEIHPANVARRLDKVVNIVNSRFLFEVKK